LTVTQACVVKYAFFDSKNGYFPLGLDQIQYETKTDYRCLRKCLKTESHKRPTLLKKPVPHTGYVLPCHLKTTLSHLTTDKHSYKHFRGINVTVKFVFVHLHGKKYFLILIAGVP